VREMQPQLVGDSVRFRYSRLMMLNRITFGSSVACRTSWSMRGVWQNWMFCV
jgi:hypothetical protein